MDPNTPIKVHRSKIKSITEDYVRKSIHPNRKVELHMILRPRTTLPSLKMLGKTKRIFTLEAFEKRFQASSEGMRAVTKFAKEKGLEVTETDPGKWLISLRGTVGRINEALQIKLAFYDPFESKKLVFAHHDPFCLPPEIKPYVTGILGLSDLKLDHNIKHKKDLLQQAQVRPGKGKHTGCVTNCDKDFKEAFKSWAAIMELYKGTLPSQYPALYKFPDKYTGAGTSIGIIQLGGGYCKTDIEKFLQGCKIPGTAEVRDISVMGAQNDPCGPGEDPPEDRLLAFLEATMDVQMVLGIAPDARVVNYFTKNNSEGLYQAFMTAACDRENRPDILSMSWGGSEDFYYSKNQIDCINQALKKVSMLGITTFAASGDSGSSNGHPGKLIVNYPASSIHVTACGGTTTELSANNELSEKVWNGQVGPKAFASGGGFSTMGLRPFYQRVLDKKYRTNNKTGVPDVAANADFSGLGFKIVASGHWVGAGGTSAAAPLWAGLTARLCQAVGGKIPYFNQFLYSAAGSKAFNQILETDNIAKDSGVNDFQAGRVWNPCTGLGTPNGTALIEKLFKYMKS